VNKIFSWVSLVTGILPGMALILNGLGTPEAIRQPLGILSVGCGIVAFGAVLFLKESFESQRRQKLALLIVGFGLLGVLSLCAYWLVLELCVFREPERSLAFYPLWLDDRANLSVQSAGGRMEYYEKYGPGAVDTLSESEPIQFISTKVLLAALVSIASVALAVATGIGSAFIKEPLITDPSFHPGASSAPKRLSKKAPADRSSPKRKQGGD
jgi:hypothetical protein